MKYFFICQCSSNYKAVKQNRTSDFIKSYKKHFCIRVSCKTNIKSRIENNIEINNLSHNNHNNFHKDNKVSTFAQINGR